MESVIQAFDIFAELCVLLFSRENLSYTEAVVLEIATEQKRLRSTCLL